MFSAQCWNAVISAFAAWPRIRRRRGFFDVLTGGVFGDAVAALVGASQGLVGDAPLLGAVSQRLLEPPAGFGCDGDRLLPADLRRVLLEEMVEVGSAVGGCADQHGGMAGQYQRPSTSKAPSWEPWSPVWVRL